MNDTDILHNLKLVYESAPEGPVKELLLQASASIIAHLSEKPIIDAVVNAWENSGPVPDFHRMAQDGLRREWPVLANAIERLVLSR